MKLIEFLYRFFINPCHGCKREGNCELYNLCHGFCGDHGLNYWNMD